jgi:DNA-directed RNA polymerase delta subunit
MKTLTILFLLTTSLLAQPNLHISLGEADKGNDQIRYGLEEEIVLAQLKLKASTHEDIRPERFYARIETNGGDLRNDFRDPDIRIYHDTNEDGKYNPNSDVYLGNENLSWNGTNGYNWVNTHEFNELIIQAGDSAYILVAVRLYYNSSNGARNNVWYQLNYADNSYLEANARQSDINAGTSGAAFSGGQKRVYTDTQITSLTITLGPRNPEAKNISSPANSETMLQLALLAGANDHARIEGITFATSGSGDESVAINSARLFYDVDQDGLASYGDIQLGATIDGADITADNQDLTFSGFSQVLSRNRSRYLILVYDFVSGIDAGDKFSASLNNAANVVATTYTSGASITPVLQTTPLNSNQVTIGAGSSIEVSLAGNSPDPSIAATDAQKVPVMQLRLATSSAAAVGVLSLRFTGSGTGSTAEDIETFHLYEDVDHNGLVDLGSDRLIKSISDPPPSKAAYDSTFTFTGLSEIIPANSNSYWLLAYDFRGTATAGETFYAKFAGSSDISTTGASVTGGRATSSPITITDAPVLTVSTGLNDRGNERIDYGFAYPLVLAQYEISANGNEDVRLDELYMRIATNGGDVRNDFNDPDIRLYHDVNRDGRYQAGTDILLGDGNLNWNNEVGYNWLNAREHNTAIIPAGGSINVIAVVQLLYGSNRARDWVWYRAHHLTNTGMVRATGQQSGVSAAVSGAPLQFGEKKVVPDGSIGSLVASLGSVSPPARNIAIGAADASIFQVKLAAGSIENINVERIVFQTDGSGAENAHLDSVRLFQDVDRDGTVSFGDRQLGSTISSFSADDQDFAFSTTGEVIGRGSDELWLLVYDFKAGLGENSQFRARIDGDSSITLVGAISGGSIRPQITNQLILGQYQTLSRNGTLSLAFAGNNPAAQLIEAGAAKVSMAQLRLTASDAEDVDVTRLIVNHTTDGDPLSSVSNAYLYEDVDRDGRYSAVDDRLISTATPAASPGKTVSEAYFNFTGLSETIAAGEFRYWIIVYDFAASVVPGEVFYAKINNGSISASGQFGSLDVYGLPLIGNSMTITDQTMVTVSTGLNDRGNERIDYGFAYPLVLAQYEISANGNEDVRLDELYMRIATNGGDVRNDFNDPDIRLYHDVNRDGRYQAGTDILLGDGNLNWNNEVGYNWLNAREHNTAIIPAGGSINVIAVVQLLYGSNRARDWVWYRAHHLTNTGMVRATGQQSGVSAAVSGAPLQFGEKKVVPDGSIGSLVASLGSVSPPARNIAIGAADASIFQVKLAAGSIENINVERIVFQTDGSGAENAHLDSVRLFQDVDRDGTVSFGDRQLGSTISSFSADDQDFAFSTTGEVIGRGSDELWLLVYDFKAGLGENSQFRARIDGDSSITLVGAISGGSIRPQITNQLILGQYQTLSRNGTLSLAFAGNNPAAQLIEAGAAKVSMAQLRLTASDAEDVDVTRLIVNHTTDGDPLSSVSNAYLYEDVDRDGRYSAVDDRLISTATPAASPGKTVSEAYFNFTGLSETIAAGEFRYWIIVYDFAASVVPGEVFYAKINNGSISASGQFGSLDVYGLPLIGNSMTITDQTMLTVSTGLNDRGNERIDYGFAYPLVLAQYEISANGNEDVRLDELYMRIATNGGDVRNDFNDPDIRLYHDVNRDGRYQAGTDILLGDGNLNWNNEVGYNWLNAREHNTAIIPAGGSINVIAVVQLLYGSNRARDWVWYRAHHLTNTGMVRATGQQSGVSAAVSGAPLQFGEKKVVPDGSIGSLVASLGSVSPPARNIAIGAADASIFQVKLAAGSIENINVERIVFQTDGSGAENAHLDSVRLFQDVDRDGTVSFGDRQLGSTISSFSADDQDFAFSTTGEVIGRGSDELWLLVYDFKAGLGENSQFRARIDGDSSITLVGAISGGSIRPQITNQLILGQYQTLSRNGTLSLAFAGNNPAAQLIEAGAAKVSMAQLRLTASDAEDVDVTRLIVNHTTDGDPLSSVSNAYLYEDVDRDGRYSAVDDRLISTATPAASPGKTVSEAYFNFTGLSETIAAGEFRYWIIVYDFAASVVPGEVFYAKINNGSISASGQFGSLDVYGLPLIGNSMTITDQTMVTVSTGLNDRGNERIDYGFAYPLVLAQYEISANGNEDVRLDELYMRIATNGGDVRNDFNDPDIRLYHDVNRDGRYQAGTDILLGDGNLNWNNEVGYNWLNAREHNTAIIPAGGSINVIAVVQLLYGSNRARDWVWYRAHHLTNTGMVRATGQQSGVSAAVSGAPLQFGEKKVVPDGSIGSLVASLGSVSPPARNIAIGAADASIFQVKLAAGSIENINVERIVFQTDGSGAENAHLDSVRLFQDVDRDGTVSFGDRQLGSTISSFSADDQDFAFSTTGEVIGRGSDELWLLVYDFKAGLGENSQFRARIDGDSSITLVGAISGGSIRPQITNQLILGQYQTLSRNGTLSLAFAGNNPAAQLIEAGAAKVSMAQLRLTASDAEDVDVTRLIVNHTTDGDPLSSVSNAYLYEDVDRDGRYSAVDDRLIATATPAASPGKTVSEAYFNFTGLSETIAAGEFRYWIIVYDFAASVVPGEVFYAKINSGSISASGQFGSLDVYGLPLIGNSMTITDQTMLTVSTGLNDRGNERIDYGFAYPLVLAQYEISANGNEDVRLDELYMRIATNGGDVRNDFNDPDIRLYHDVNRDGRYQAGTDILLGDGNLNWNNEVGYNWLNAREHNTAIIPAGGSINVIAVVQLLYGSNRARDWVWYRAHHLTNTGMVRATGQQSGVSAAVSGAPLQFGEKKVVPDGSIGSLVASLGSVSPPARNIAIGAADASIFQVKLAAGSIENINVERIVFQTDGSGAENAHLDSVRLFQDVDRDGTVSFGDRQLGSTISSFSADDQDFAFSTTGEVIGRGSDELWLLVYDFKAGLGENSQFRARIDGDSSITLVGAISGGSIRPQITNQLILGQYQTLSQIGSLTLAAGTNMPPSRAIVANSRNLAVAQMRFSASSSEDVRIDSLYLLSAGSVAAADIDSVRLFVDSDRNGLFNELEDRWLMTETAIPGNPDTLFFTNLNEVIEAATEEFWLLVYYLNGQASGGENLYLQAKPGEAVFATGVATSQAIAVNGSNFNSNIFTVTDQGLLQVALGPNDGGNKEILYGYSGAVVLMQLNVAASTTEDIRLNSVYCKVATNGGDLRNDFSDPDVRVYLDVNNDGLLQSGSDLLLGDNNLNWNNEFGYNWINLREQRDQIVPAGSNVNLLFVVNLLYGSNRAREWVWYEQTFAANNYLQGTGMTSANAVAIAGAPVTGGLNRIRASGTPGELSISAGSANPLYRRIQPGSSVESMLQLQLTASPLEHIRIDTLRLQTLGSGDEGNRIDSARLFIDTNGDGLLQTGELQLGPTIPSAAISDNGELQFVDISRQINLGTKQNWLVVYSLNTQNSDHEKTFQVRLHGSENVYAHGLTSGARIVPAISNELVSGGRLTISLSGEIILSAGVNNPNGGTLSGNEAAVEMLQMALRVADIEPVTVDSISFIHQGSGALAEHVSRIQLIADNNGNGSYEIAVDPILSTIAIPPSQSDRFTFRDLDTHLPQNGTMNWLLVYDFNGTAVVGQTFNVKLLEADYLIARGDSTGTQAAVKGDPSLPIVGANYVISANGSLALQIGGSDPGPSAESKSASAMSVLQFRLTAGAVEDLRISSIRFTGSGSGNESNDIASGGVRLFRDTNNDGRYDVGDIQIGSAVNYTGNNGTATFAAIDDTITAGSSVHWLLVYTLNGNAASGSTFRAGIYDLAITCNGVSSGVSIVPQGIPLVGYDKTIASVGNMTLARGTNDPGNRVVDKSQTGITITQLRISAGSVESVFFNRIVFTHDGSGNPQTDLFNLGAGFISDANGDGLYRPADGDVRLAQASLNDNRLIFTGLTATVPADSQRNFLVVYDFNGNSRHNDTYALQLGSADSIDATGEVSLQPVSILGQVPYASGVVTTTANTNISTLATDIGGGNLPPGSTRRPIMRLDFTPSPYPGGIDGLRIDNRSPSGMNSAADIALVRVFVDDGNDLFNPALDTEIASGPMTEDGNGGFCLLNFSSTVPIPLAGSSIFITYDADLNANPDNAAGVDIGSATYLIGAPATTFASGDFPLSSQFDFSLPVNMIAWQADPQAGQVDLQWETASEVDNLGFIIERADPEKEFMTIATYADSPTLRGKHTSADGAVYKYSDAELTALGNYRYRLIQVDSDGTTRQLGDILAVEVSELRPLKFELLGNYPNPFNPSTTILFALPQTDKVSIIVYASDGREVIKLAERKEMAAGKQRLNWNGRNQHGQTVASGIYYYIIKTSSTQASSKMLLLR